MEKKAEFSLDYAAVEEGETILCSLFTGGLIVSGQANRQRKKSKEDSVMSFGEIVRYHQEKGG
jgi:hypothetical protein